MRSDRGEPLFVFVFFPADIADLAGEPTRHPVAKVRNRVFGSTSKALGFGGNFQVLDFNFRHTEANSLK